MAIVALLFLLALLGGAYLVMSGAIALTLELLVIIFIVLVAGLIVIVRS